MRLRTKLGGSYTPDCIAIFSSGSFYILLMREITLSWEGVLLPTQFRTFNSNNRVIILKIIPRTCSVVQDFRASNLTSVKRNLLHHLRWNGNKHAPPFNNSGRNKIEINAGGNFPVSHILLLQFLVRENISLTTLGGSCNCVGLLPVEP